MSEPYDPMPAAGAQGTDPQSSSGGAGAGGSGAGSGGTGEQGNATLILVLGILSLVCCNLLGPVAWFMGKQELDGIAAGRISAAQEGTVKAGMILGIICTVLLAIGLVIGVMWLIFGGLAVVGAALEAQ